MKRHRLMRQIVVMGGKQPWYLAGGISRDSCIVVYQPKWAASYTASKVNIVNPGTYDLSDGVAFPTWASETGWTFDAASSQYLSIGDGGLLLKPFTAIARITRTDTASEKVILGRNIGSDNIIWKIVTTQPQSIVNQGIVVIGSSIGIIDHIDTIIAVSYSSTGEYIFFKDGVAEAPVTSDTNIIANTDTIGQKLSSEYFDGDIKALSIYNNVLSAAQILAISTIVATL